MVVELDPKTIKAIENIRRSILKIQHNVNPLAKTIEQIQESISLPYARLNQQIQMAFEPFVEMNTRISAQLQTAFQPYAKIIKTLQEHIDNIAKISGPISFNDALAEVSRVYEEAQEEAKGNQETALNIVIQKVEVKIDSSPKGALSLEFIISLFFSLILCLASLQAGNQTEVRTTQNISRLEEKIDHLANFILNHETNSTYYVVDRPVNFRNKPTTRRSIVLEVLPKKLKVELIERKGKWINVRFFDHNDQIYKYGWVYKKYLKMIK